MAPETSIVIRTYNEEKHISRLLEDLEQQTYRDFEVVLVDSGSTDRTVDLASKYISNIYHMPKEEFTFGRSLNIGCRHAKGKYLVSISAHIYPLTNTWLANLIRPFEDSTIGMVYGSQRVGEENSVAEERGMIYNFGDSSRIWIDQPAGHNGNSAIRQALWLEHPFDEQLTGFEDIEWAKRIQLNGHRVFYAADARVAHIHEESIPQVYRRFFREALAFKQIFPGYRLSKIDATKFFAYSVAGDVVFALRNRKSLNKLARIIPERTVEWLSKYRATKYHTTITRELKHKFITPLSSESVIIKAPNQHSLCQTKVPELGPNDVLIQVGYINVCAVDVALLRGSLEHCNGSGFYPPTPGNECSGLVIKCGTGVREIQTGNKVITAGAANSSQSDDPKNGPFHQFPQQSESNEAKFAWLYTRYIKLPSLFVHKVPNDLMLREASAFKLLATCIRALKEIEVHRGEQAYVIGAGPMGNLIAQLLSSKGLKVTVVDPEEKFLSLLWRYNVDTLTTENTLNKFDVIINTSLANESTTTSIEGANPSAKVLTIGHPAASATKPVSATGNRNQAQFYDLTNSLQVDWREAIQLVNKGAINLEDHTSVVFSLENYQAAWKAVEERRHLGVLINANQELAPV